MKSTTFATVQWFAFIVAGSIIVPIVTGVAFNLSPSEISSLLQRSLLVIGIASILQAWLGHKLPVYEGPAGMWWGVFLVLATVAPSMGKDYVQIFRELQMGLIIAGGLLILLGLTGLLGRIQLIFTPLVTGTYMILLSLQMSGAFINGLLGVGYLHEGMNGTITLISILLIALVILLSSYAKGAWRNFSILVGLITGIGLYLAFGLYQVPNLAEEKWVKIPEISPFGLPQFDWGITLTSILTALVLISNIIASIEAMSSILQQPSDSQKVNRGGIVSGFSNLLSGIYGTVGMVPISISAGLVSISKITSRRPFFLASLGVIIVAFFPKVLLVIASLPEPVGYAVLFVSFSKLISIGLEELQKTGLDNNTLTICGVSIMGGTGIMFIPPEALQQLPELVQTFISNGLLMGVLVTIFLEQIVFRQRRRKKLEV